MDATPRTGFDPLAAIRGAEQEDGVDSGCDLLLTGTVFQDIIFTGLDRSPEPGTEVWSQGMGTCPGGVANQAIAAARLGLRTSLAAAFGDDGYGDFNWRILESQEHVDLSLSRRFEGWHSPVTVSLCVDQDRSMVTHGHPSPMSASELIGDPPKALAAVADLAEEPEPWMLAARKAGVKLFGDAGWDPTGAWSSKRLDQLSNFYAFMPNQREAMAFTGKDNPWSALYTLADRVPVAVVTLGAQGAMAVDSETGEEESVPSLPVTAYDPTGAGDCFGAAFVVGCLARWPWETGSVLPIFVPRWRCRKWVARWLRLVGETSPIGGNEPTPAGSGSPASGSNGSPSSRTLWRTSRPGPNVVQQPRSPTTPTPERRSLAGQAAHPAGQPLHPQSTRTPPRH